MNKTTNNGLTLVEVIVTMIIASVIAGIIITIYTVQAKEVRTSMSFAKANRGYDLYLEQLGQDIRFSTAVSMPTTSLLLSTSEGEVSYEIRENGILYHNGEMFSTGANVPLVVDHENSFFTIHNPTSTVSSEIVLITDEGKKLPVRKDTFRWRN